MTCKGKKENMTNFFYLHMSFASPIVCKYYCVHLIVYLLQTF